MPIGWGPGHFFSHTHRPPGQWMSKLSSSAVLASPRGQILVEIIIGKNSLNYTPSH